MFCPNCGIKQPDSANFCHGCGSKIPTRSINTENTQNSVQGLVEQNTATSQQGPKKYSAKSEALRYFLLNTITFGLYAPYWGWRRWKFIGKIKNQKTSPVLGGIFLGFTSFSMFRDFQTLAHDRTNLTPSYSPRTHGTFLLLLFLLSNGAGRSELDFGSTLVGIIFLTALEALVIKAPSGALAHLLNNDAEAREAYQSIGHNYWMIIFLVALGILLIFVGALSQATT